MLKSEIGLREILGLESAFTKQIIKKGEWLGGLYEHVYNGKSMSRTYRGH